MTYGPWKWISTSVRGTSHATTGQECQDNHICIEIPAENGPVLLAVVSDGAGSASRSAVGSGLVCNVLRDRAVEFFSEQGRIDQVNPRLIASWIEMFRSEVVLHAASEGVPDREYACTVLGVIIAADGAAMFQIGDGAIVYSSNSTEAYSLAFWPGRGEYENTTFFATQANFLEQLQFLFVPRVIEIALLSDGLQRLALSYQDQSAHQRFFAGLFPAVRKSKCGRGEELSHALSEFLDSPKVNERTDDDKTLVLATLIDVVSTSESAASGVISL